MAAMISLSSSIQDNIRQICGKLYAGGLTAFTGISTRSVAPTQAMIPAEDEEEEDDDIYDLPPGQWSLSELVVYSMPSLLPPQRN